MATGERVQTFPARIYFRLKIIFGTAEHWPTAGECFLVAVESRADRPLEGDSRENRPDTGSREAQSVFIPVGGTKKNRWVFFARQCCISVFFFFFYDITRRTLKCRRIFFPED